MKAVQFSEYGEPDVLHVAAQCVLDCNLLLAPFLPHAANRVWAVYGGQDELMPMPRVQHVEDLDPGAGAGLGPYPVITGDYASSTLFVQKLQAASAAKTGAQLARAFLVQKITVAPLAGATDTSSTSSTTSRAKKGQVQTTLSGQIFVLKTAPIPTVSVPAAGAGSTS